jgi:TetR/AcrR family transcriptional regulator, tetracycline repressor protein
VASTQPEPALHRARRPRLSSRRVVDEALAMIDEHGMAAVTMRGLAARLGVEAMSLYKHVTSRGKLFDAVVDRIVDELTEDPAVTRAPVAGWRPYLAGIAHGIRRYARAHPNAFPLVATRPTEASWINPPLRSVSWIEAFLAGLQSEGFTDAQILFAYRTFNSFLLGFLLMETSAMTTQLPVPPDGPRATIDQARYPTIHRLADGLSEDYFLAEFEAGLHAMLDQIGARLHGRPGEY